MSTDIWIKHASDKSAWPNFPATIHTADGLLVSDNDTAFDVNMRTFAGPDTRVFVGPGLFLTRGATGNAYQQADAPGFRMQSGASLIGAGEGGYLDGGTTLRLAAANDRYGGLVVGSNEFAMWKDDDHFEYTTASGICVSDLEIDCNGPALSKALPLMPWYLQGVQLFGAGGCRVERVSVINAMATGPNAGEPKTECFILCVNAPPGAFDRNVIANCSVSNFFNPSGLGCCSAISMNSWGKGTVGGEIRDCSVELNGNVWRVPGGEFAYNAACAKGLVISGCRSKGAQRGFNNDTWPNWDMLVSGNYFELPGSGCIGFLLKKPNQGSWFTENTIVVKGSNGSGFLIERDPNGNNLALVNNRVIAVGTWAGKSYAINCNSNLMDELIPTNVELSGNEIVSTPGARLDPLVPATMGSMKQNTINGVEWRWPVPQPNPGWEF